MSQFMVKPPTYWLVFTALVVLTVVTVAASRLPIVEPWHTLLALTIAVMKAMLVILIFMHVLYSERLTWVVALGSIAWLIIFVGLTLNDYLTRDWDRWQPKEIVVSR